MTNKEDVNVDVDVDVDAHEKLHYAIMKACNGHRIPVIGTVLATAVVDVAMVSSMSKEQFTLMMSQLWDVTLKEREKMELEDEVKH